MEQEFEGQKLATLVVSRHSAHWQGQGHSRCSTKDAEYSLSFYTGEVKGAAERREAVKLQKLGMDLWGAQA